MKRAVITGATGAIGRSLIKTCMKAGYEVLTVVHRESARAGELETIEHCQVLRLNLNEYDHALEEMKRQGIKTENYELFFHLAWMSPFGKARDDLALQLKNAEYTLDAVKFAKTLGCSVFIGTGSQAEYGRVEGKLSPVTPAFPETGYGVAKLCAGQLSRLSCEQLGMKHIWCRVLSVYGPYDREQTLISTAVIKMMANEETDFTPCEQIWDYIYSDDAASAILTAAQHGAHGQVFVVGSGDAKPLKEYIKTISEITGYTKPIGFGKRSYNDKQVMYLQADTEDLVHLGFRAETSFEEGIRRIVKWRSKR